MAAGEGGEAAVGVGVWEARTHPVNGAVYYINRTTGESSWTKPPAQQLQPHQPQQTRQAPETQMQARQFVQQQYMLFQQQQQQQQDASGPATAPAPAVGVGDWEEAQDATTGRMYYYNRSRRQSSWIKPAALR